MKPVAIFRHTRSEGPGYFATFLEQHRIDWTLIPIDEGAAVPEDSSAYAGLALMGGPMSVNDPLPWIAPMGALIRDAVRRQRPVIGHCLGGQLISQALGGTVTRNPVKEIGWGSASASEHPLAASWLGDFATAPATVFQWHGETFSLPEGATRILGNPWCANQMFVMGPHLAMQCHVEMTPALIARWCEDWAAEVAGLLASGEPLPASVQTPAQMQADTARHLPVMRALADRLYGQWIARLPRD